VTACPHIGSLCTRGPGWGDRGRARLGLLQHMWPSSCDVAAIRIHVRLWVFLLKHMQRARSSVASYSGEERTSAAAIPAPCWSRGWQRYMRSIASISNSTWPASTSAAERGSVMTGSGRTTRPAKGHQPLHAVHERAHPAPFRRRPELFSAHISQSPARLVGLGRSPVRPCTVTPIIRDV
jgi:hypothetical protein